jgi:hypothetical protein
MFLVGIEGKQAQSLENIDEKLKMGHYVVMGHYFIKSLKAREILMGN